MSYDTEEIDAGPRELVKLLAEQGIMSKYKDGLICATRIFCDFDTEEYREEVVKFEPTLKAAIAFLKSDFWS